MKRLDYKIKTQNALDLSKTRELSKAIFLKIDKWTLKFIKEIKNNKIFLISRNINSIKILKQKEKNLQSLLNAKIVDKLNQIFENDFVNIVQIKDIVSRAQINFFNTNNLDQNFMNAKKTKNHNKLLKVKIFQIRKSNCSKIWFYANELFYFKKVSSNVKKIKLFEKRIKKIIQKMWT